MNNFRFGLWVGFVASIVFAALWGNEPEANETIDDRQSAIEDEGSVAPGNL